MTEHVQDTGELEGELTFELVENANLGEYNGGRLKVSAAPSLKMTPLFVDFQASVAKVQLGLNRSPIPLFYKKGEAVSSGDLRVETRGKNAAPIIGQEVTVKIPNIGFSRDELWLETRGQPPNQALILPHSEDTFQILFRPRATHNTGYYPFQLDVSVKSPGFHYEPEYGAVELNFDAPQFDQVKPEPVLLQRGKTLFMELKVGLKEGAAPNREVSFQCKNPDTKRPDSPTFRFEEEATPNSSIELEPLETVKLKPGAAPVPQSLRIKVSAPPQVHCGRYTLLNGELSASLIKSQPVDLVFHVNDLEVVDLKGNEVKRSLFFYQIKGTPLVRKFQVFLAHGDLEPGQIQVTQEGAFLDVNNNTENPRLQLKPVNKIECKYKGNGRSGVEISLEFADVEPSFRPYSGDIVIHYEKLGLTRTIQCGVQLVELLRSKSSGSVR